MKVRGEVVFTTLWGGERRNEIGRYFGDVSHVQVSSLCNESFVRFSHGPRKIKRNWNLSAKIAGKVWIVRIAHSGYFCDIPRDSSLITSIFSLTPSYIIYLKEFLFQILKIRLNIWENIQFYYRIYVESFELKRRRKKNTPILEQRRQSQSFLIPLQTDL